jgi:DNA-binding Lrp family transcriptional regulator
MYTHSVNNTATLDMADRRIVCALQFNGRASAVRIATALGLAERTVTRRLNRLLDVGIVRVVLSQAAASETESVTVILRVRVLKGKVADIAAALARRDDIQFVDIMENGQEIVASSTTPTASRAQLLVNGIASGSDVIEVTSHTGLHLYADPASWNLGLLTPDESEALVHPAIPESPDWTVDDPQIRNLLASNARMPLAELARRTGLPISTLRRRVERLEANGLLRTVAIVDRMALGLGVDANISMHVPPALIDAVGHRLATSPGVHGAAATTGEPNMFAAVYSVDLPGLHDFVIGTLGPLGVTAAEVNLVRTSVKQAGALVSGLLA